MITKIGVVGPKDSVELICSVGKEFENIIISIPFIYQHVEETALIVQKSEPEVDVWFFSGPAPYSIAKDFIKKKAFYPQPNESILSRVLLEILYRDRLPLDRVSFDTFSDIQFRETLNDLGIACEKPLLFPIAGFKPSEDLLAFHTAKYRKGEADACVTGLRSVYEELKELGIPVYRMVFNRMTLREIYKLACKEGETLHFKRSQIAVQLIEIDEIEKMIAENKNAYDMRRLDLKLQELILDYAEAIAGSFVSLGNGKFIIFSTRGSFEDNTDYSAPYLLEKITLLTEAVANMGLGFGITALAAERNAQLALLHAKKFNGCSAIVVDDDGSIQGPLQQPESLCYGYRTENKEIIDTLKKAGVSITTLNKILSVQKVLGQNAISASDIAEWMSMTERNARRILSDLAEHKLVQLIGEEVPTSRGRPRKIYRVMV